MGHKLKIMRLYFLERKRIMILKIQDGLDNNQ